MKRIFSLLLCLCVLASLSIAFGANVSDFTDIKTTDWYYSDVSYVVSHGMFNGMSATKFGPGETMTRGMFVTLLGRYAGTSGIQPPTGDDNTPTMGRVTNSDVNMRSAPSTSGTTVLACLARNTQVEILDKVSSSDGTSYKWYKVNYSGTVGYIREDLMTPISGTVAGAISDVAADKYYAPFVYWAVENGIAEKTGENSFSPETQITREDICFMLYNYAKMTNYKLPSTAASITFTDDASITSSRKEAVSAFQKASIITGYPDGTFQPKNKATRAEVSAFMVRFINAISYKPDNSSSIDANGNYIWGAPVPEGITMNSSYLNDACFIGHSIVVGMENYFGLDQTDFFALNSANTTSILTYNKFDIPNPYVDDDGKIHDTGTLEEALNTKTYGKVYIMLGTNEIGSADYHRNTFSNNLSGIVDMVRRLQPNAKIYLMGITPVTKTCSESRADLNRDNIVSFNKAIRQVCANKRCYYLNIFDMMVDSNGFLRESDGMSDGIHILRPQYIAMKSYILNHAV